MPLLVNFYELTQISKKISNRLDNVLNIRKYIGTSWIHFTIKILFLTQEIQSKAGVPITICFSFINLCIVDNCF